MAISTSLIVLENMQPDGRRWVHERHTDSTGHTHDVHYLAAAGSDLTAQMTVHATALDDTLRDTEITDNAAELEI